MGVKRKIERIIGAFKGEKILGVSHYGWYGSDWLARFALAWCDKQKVKQNLGFYSVFQPHWALRLHKNQKKVFFTGENVHRYKNYEDSALPFVDLSLGFDDLPDSNYLRFPLWILYLFAPTDTPEQIRQKCADINARHPQKTKFASLIARKDSVDGLRGEIFNAVNKIAPVSAAGRLFHNDDDLWTKYNNCKIAYLSDFQFSICPENTNNAGYVTEKLFESFLAGAVPIYWGSDNAPEKGLVNENAIIFWDKGGDNAKALEVIERLYKDKKAYDEFVHQPRFNDAMADFVIARFDELKRRLNEILELQ